MEVEFVDTGCNIMSGEDSFVNYSPDSRTRTNYIISNGQVFKISESYSQYGYSYSGTCLHTGDLIYKPELQVYFPLLCFGIISIALVLIYNIIFKRFIK